MYCHVLLDQRLTLDSTSFVGIRQCGSNSLLSTTTIRKELVVKKLLFSSHQRRPVTRALNASPYEIKRRLKVFRKALKKIAATYPRPIGVTICRSIRDGCTESNYCFYIHSPLSYHLSTRCTASGLEASGSWYIGNSSRSVRALASNLRRKSPGREKGMGTSRQAHCMIRKSEGHY